MTPDQPSAQPVEIRGDFLNQLRFVGDAASRLISMQDRDPRSPALGSFHYAFWRDKTSEFADARFQEAGAALGLLAHPRLAALRRQRGWPGEQELTGACHAGLVNLQRLQYPQGCYDEWYRGERGFAATAFSTFAYAAAAVFLGPALPEPTRTILIPVLQRSADWLARRNDSAKSNHQVAAAAALAAVGQVTGEARWFVAAADKLATSLSWQTPEGWFPELAGMDFGYSSLVLDYLMLYHRITGDKRALEAASRLLSFLLPHLHPDVTLSAEGGTCRNGYCGQCGFLLLAGHEAAGRAITAKLAGLRTSQARISAYLGDDLRLARWSVLPILGALIFESDAPSLPGQMDIPYPEGWTVHEQAAAAAFHRDRLHVYWPFAGGAITRVFSGSDLAVCDRGADVIDGAKTFTSLTYAAERPTSRSGESLAVTIELARQTYFYPGFLPRLLLRLGSITATASQATRAIIDWYRRRARTAVNQSSSAVGRNRRSLLLSREIAVGNGEVTVVDILRGVRGMRVEPQSRDSSDAANDLQPFTADCESLTLRRSFAIPAGGKETA